MSLFRLDGCTVDKLGRKDTKSGDWDRSLERHLGRALSQCWKESLGRAQQRITLKLMGWTWGLFRG